MHPEERVQELGRKLATWPGNEDLRQDLIDYVWLLDRFEFHILEDEEKRKEALKPLEERQNSNQSLFNEAARTRYEALESGELISVGFQPKQDDGQPDYSKYVSLDFKPDVSESEMLQAFESRVERKLDRRRDQGNTRTSQGRARPS